MGGDVVPITAIDAEPGSLRQLNPSAVLGRPTGHARAGLLAPVGGRGAPQLQVSTPAGPSGRGLDSPPVTGTGPMPGTLTSPTNK